MSTSHLTSIDLDLLAMNSLAPEKADEARVHLVTCDQCKADFDEHKLAREKFTQEILPRTMGAVRTRVEKEGIVLGARPGAAQTLRRFLFVLLPVSALAIVFLIARKPNSPESDADLIAKGGPSLQLFALRGGKVFSVHEGPDAERLQQGDHVRLVILPGKSPFALIGSVDGGGHTSLWFPAHEAASGAVDPNQRNEPPGSFVLDDSQGPERLFAVFSKTPIAAAELRAAMKALGAQGPEAVRAAQTLEMQSPIDSEATFLIEKAAP